MANIDDIRVANLRLLIAECDNSQAALAERTDTPAAYISQVLNRMINPSTGNPRNLGKLVARRMESKMGKAEGWMDQPHAAEPKATYNVQPLP